MSEPIRRVHAARAVPFMTGLLILVGMGALGTLVACGRPTPPPETPASHAPPAVPVPPVPSRAPLPPMQETAAADGAEMAPASVEIDCGGTLQPVRLSPSLPKTPTFQSEITLESLQCDFDVFSWNTFIALDHSLSGAFGDRGGDNATTWGAWPNEGDIFRPDGSRPPEWQAGQPPPREPIPPVCEGKGRPGDLVLEQIGKQPLLVEASLQPFKSGPLIDVHGRYARFGITVNQPMYQYIWENRLYNRAGQKAFCEHGGSVEFPCGCNGDATGTTCPPEGQQGAVMVKAAWKVLDTAAGDDPSRFHTSHALVITPAVGDEPETCERQLVGLVGLHIATKTQGDPQWVWSTFEQVDNVPTAGEAPPAGRRYNFFQPGCTDCNAVNEPPPQPWDPHVQPVTDNAGKSQVVRQIPITDDTKTLNADVQPLLAGTVWRHYELVSTQWPTDASGSAPSNPSAANNWCNPLNPIDETGAPAPAFLANTTLETYIQGTVPQASSSCIHCHQNATMAEGQKSFSDFTYLLERAH